MTATIEAKRANRSTEKSRQQKRLSQSRHELRKPLYSAVFATPPTRRRARTAAWNCINLGKNIDPACGSGAFLVVCFELISQRLIEIHSYMSELENANSYFVTNNNKTYLTVDAKREIIKNCLYGVDVDEAAIEVSKMSLALKVIDDNDLSILEEIGVFGGKILRDVHSNIKLGNTLVDIDISLSPEKWQSVKPLDIFNSGFADVFSNHGGFDFVVGNPPYVETKHYRLASPSMHEYIKEKFISFEGKADLAIIFIERCLSFLNGNGRLGFIVQKRFFKTTYGKAIRQMLSNRHSINKVIDIKTDKLFPGRMTYVAIMILTSHKNDAFLYESIPYEPIDLKTHFEKVITENDETIEQVFIPTSVLSDGDVWAFESYKLLEQITELSKRFGAFGNYPNLHIKDGVQVLWKKVYHLTDYVISNGFVTGNNGFGENVKIELAATRPIIYNRLFHCFMDLQPTAYAIVPYEGSENKTPIKISEMKRRFPLAYAYLVKYEEIIKANVNYFNDDELWHTYTRVHNHDTFLEKKIIIPMTAKDTIATCSLDEGLYMDNANVWFIKVVGADDSEMKALTAIINSTAFSVFAKATANPQSGGYYKLNKQFLYPVPFPIKNIVGNKSIIEQLALLHDEIATLQNNFASSTPTSRDIVRSALEKKWSELDNICFILYELDEAQTQLIHNEGRTVCRVSLLGGV
ncbi:MAG: BREX-1 system adenine-specific DNA-methyltransferase PglX [Lachnospiraceae bacterium]|nr:BREX-1 system adenine-specific DNA-methyltransferase PglX [Lachnospiraceae bacterium]